MLGQRASYAGPVNGSQLQVDISGLDNGVHVIRLMNVDTGNTLSRILVKRRGQ